MPRFVRKYIPYFTNEKLMEEYKMNRELEKVALKNMNYRMCRYYDNNRILLSRELVRRMEDLEGIYFLNSYMLVEDAKIEIKNQIQRKEAELMNLDERLSNIKQVNWEHSLTYLNSQLDNLNTLYPSY